MRKLFNLIFLILIFSFAISLVSADIKPVNVHVVVSPEKIDNITNGINPIQGEVIEVDKQTNIKQDINSFLSNINKPTTKPNYIWIFSFSFIAIILIFIIYRFRESIFKEK